jgi:integrase/recombinase XerD
MRNEVLPVGGHSPLAPLMEQFVQEKRACGYRYVANASVLRRFDAFLCQQGLQRCELSKALSWQWLDKQPHENANTHLGWISVVRQFAMFLVRMGHPADVPDRNIGARAATYFVPRILTHDEVRRVIDAVDRLEPDAQTPTRHIIMPEVFRLLYGCGLRLGEVLKLRVDDVDLVQGVLRINRAKFGKDRLVPPALPLVQRLQKYAAEIGRQPADAYFFPSPRGGHWSSNALYWMFRDLLMRCHIAHGGRGQGPRIHDLRHTFAVHTLLRWYREGADLDARLPVLATYLGHAAIEGTQQYLHLTAELFPEVIVRSDRAFGDVIPRRSAS